MVFMDESVVLYMLSTWIEVLNHFEKIIVLRNGFFLRFCEMIIIR